MNTYIEHIKDISELPQKPRVGALASSYDDSASQLFHIMASYLFDSI